MVKKDELDQAIKNHLQWRSNLLSCASGHHPEEWRMNSEIAADPSLCQFGQWFSKITKNEKLLNDIEMEHIHFHKAASRILVCCERKDFKSAHDFTDGNSEFMESALKLVGLLRDLKKQYS